MRLFNNLLLAAVLLLAGMFIHPVVAKADVTGSFGTHVSIRPQTTTDEFSLINFDVENNLDVAVVISGLKSEFHSHFGIAGVEDVTVSSSATIGTLDISAKLVYGRFAYGSTTPFYNSLHFIKKMVTASFSLGGVTFSTLSQFEDTAAFVSLTPAYAFGWYIRFAGQTPSGVSVSGGTGFCIQFIPNSIKKHFEISKWTVNPECATAPKPDILFDQTRLEFTGVPLAPGVTASVKVLCIQATACTSELTLAFAGGPVPIKTSLMFDDLLSLSFTGAEITLTSGSGTMVISITPQGTIGVVELVVAATLNPDTLPATLSLELEVEPGIGVTEALIAIGIERAGLAFEAEALFSGGPPVEFSELAFTLAASGQMLSLATELLFTPRGLVQADLLLTLHF